MEVIFPPKLKFGDTICLISPSSGMAKLVPHRAEKAISNLNKAGFKIKVGKNALKNLNYASASPQERALDLMEAFLDPEVKAIMSFIGGYCSNQILKYLDFDIIRKNPKILVGYSDTTIPLLAIHTQTGICTYYGPAALTQFGENPDVFEYTLNYFKKALIEDGPIGDVFPSEFWTDQVLDWFKKLDQRSKRQTFPNQGWKWIKEGEAKGPLIGGCLVSLINLAGTKYWPNFNNAILFWETPESDGNIHQGISIPKTADCLEHLNELGVFNKISGMIIGRPVGYSEANHEELICFLKDFFSNYNFPVLYNVNFGHSDPIITIPIGQTGVLNSDNNQFKIL